MAISNFKLPTGLEVSGTSTITGSVGVSQTLTAVNLTASGAISGSVGNYGSLFVNGSAVLTSVGLGAYALSADVSSSFVQPSQVSASYVTPAQVSASFAKPADVSASFAKPADVSASFAKPADISASFSAPSQVSASFVQPSQVSASYTTPSQITGAVAFLTASNVFTVSQQITGGLSMTGDLSAQSASLTGDLTVNGNLTVKGVTTSIDSTTVNIGDKNINLGTGSAVLSVLDGGGLDLGTSANVQWRYDNANSAWTSNVGINVTGALPAVKLAGVSALTRVAGANALVNSTFGSVSITNTSITTLSGALTASVTAPTITVGSPSSTSASLNAANAVTVGSVSTVATAINGATTTVVGVNGLILSGANVYVTGNTYFNSTLSGTTAQFTSITGSTVTGSTALFTTVSASAMSASTLLVNSLNPTYIYEGANNFLTVSAGATGTIDTFAWATYEAGKYLVKAKEQGGSNWVHAAEILVASDGTYNIVTPYASTYSSTSSLLQFVADPITDANVYVRLGNLSSQAIVVKWVKTYITK
jgi:hypothetical protein